MVACARRRNTGRCSLPRLVSAGKTTGRRSSVDTAALLQNTRFSAALERVELNQGDAGCIVLAADNCRVVSRLENAEDRCLSVVGRRCTRAANIRRLVVFPVLVAADEKAVGVMQG